jgi:transmembrane sensor
MDKDRLFELLTKYQDNSCTEQELQELEQWYQTLNTGNPSIPDSNAETFANEMLAQFRSNLVTERRTIPFYRKTLFRVAAAAVVIIAIGISSYFAFFNKGSNEQPVTKNEQPVDITAPNSTKAYITLSTGKRISLDSLQNGSVAIEGNLIISKQGDKIIYANNQQSSNSNVFNHTLSIEKGSKPYKLLLADGSEVWLDAATTITYPNAFVGKERRVEIITGQAYFEVAHNTSMPFKVKKGNAEVEVLGTHFNISAFDDEEIKVTLLEGSVRISPAGGGDLSDANKLKESGVVLKPGQQAVIARNEAISTNNSPDLDEVMAWKNGNFQFEGADINNVMKQLARWYDVDVEVKGNIPAHFGGTISREVNVSKVFEMLKLTGEVNYKIDGRKIIVTP